MATFHSTVSRREFMKGLGLVSAGIGGAAAVAPAFHDLDEVLSAGESTRKRAWYVKEVDEPTVEIDWSMIKRHYGGHSTQSAAVVARYTGLAEYNAMTKSAKSDIDRMKANEPGYRLRDAALGSANGGIWSGMPYTPAAATFGASGGVTPTCEADKFGRMKVQTPEQRGVPKWTGTPEEATKMLRAVMVFFGAANMGASELDDHHKNFVGLTGDNYPVTYYPGIDKAPTTVTKPVVFADQPKFSWDAAKNITYVPNIPLWATTYLIPQHQELNLRRPSVLGRTTQTRYRLRRETTTCTQDFITGIGYQSMADVPYRVIPSGPGIVLTGLGENARHSIMTLSPEVGAFGGYFDMLTDLELAPTKPIDAGMWRFCHSCGLCADLCPSGSIMKKGEGEPSFEVRPSKITPKDPPLPGMREAGEFHKLGRKTYWTDMPGSQIYQRSVDTCNVCWGNCVFNGANGAMIHQVVKGTAAVTPLFNGFFSSMHEPMGYGMKTGEAIEEWWDMSLPSNGFSSTMMARHMGY